MAIWLLSTALGILILLAIAFYFFQGALIFHPSRLPQNYVFRYSNAYEELMLSTPDGENINGLLFRSARSKGVILYFHGNAGNLSDWGIIADQFLPLHYDLFIIDYRSFGKSSGRITEENLYQDALLSYKFLLKRGYATKDIVIYGRSIGTGVASWLATKVDHKALVLESPFNNMASLAKHYFPFFSPDFLLRFRFPTSRHIAQVKTPVYILHGAQDEVIPFELARKLKDENPELTFYTFEHGGHNNLSAQEGFESAIKSILK